MNKGKIAFFDSGVGGLTTLHLAKQQLAHEDFIYFGDCVHAPYGTKSTEQVCQLVLDAVHFLLEKECKAIVLACNTATSAAIHLLREQFDIPVIGMEPAVKLAGKLHSGGRILITATDATLKGQKLSDLIRDLKMDDLVDELSLQELVMFAERFEFDSDALYAYLEEKLGGYDWSNYHSLVLGCTHFIYFKNQLRRFIPESVNLLDGNQGTINRLISLIEPGEGSGQIEFYISGTLDNSGYFDRFLAYLDQQ